MCVIYISHIIWRAELCPYHYHFWQVAFLNPYVSVFLAAKQKQHFLVPQKIGHKVLTLIIIDLR